jgi:hypothetical protein
MESPANNDEGKGWRQVLTPRLNERGIYCFDPTREEISKVGMSTKKFIKKVKQYQQDDARDKFITSMDKIWKGVDKISEVDKKVTSVHIIGDIGYVENSDFLVWNWDKGDQPGGSIIEATIAWYRKIPIYLISEMEAAEFNTSIYYFILSSGGNQGQHFNNQADLLEFIDKKYNLKIKQ